MSTNVCVLRVQYLTEVMLPLMHQVKNVSTWHIFLKIEAHRKYLLFTYVSTIFWQFSVISGLDF